MLGTATHLTALQFRDADVAVINTQAALRSLPSSLQRLRLTERHAVCWDDQDLVPDLPRCHDCSGANTASCDSTRLGHLAYRVRCLGTKALALSSRLCSPELLACRACHHSLHSDTTLQAPRRMASATQTAQAAAGVPT